MRRLGDLCRCERGAAAAEMVLTLPIMLVLMFGSLELGNFFLTQHALSKQVRDGARFATRLPLVADYDCSTDPADIFEDSDTTDTLTPTEMIVNVTKTGSVTGAATGRFSTAQWNDSCSGESVDVTVRCVPKGTTYAGIYTGLADDIPVVQVSADISYLPLTAGAFGFDGAGLCLSARSEGAVMGL